MTALWKQNSLIMWKYLKEELFTAVKILKGNPAPTPNNKESASKGDRQRLKQSGSCWENYLEQKRGGCVFVSFDIKDRSSILLSLGFPFWSSHLTKQYLIWMNSIYFLKEKSCENLYKQSWLTLSPVHPFVSIQSLDTGWLSFYFQDHKLYLLDISLLISRTTYIQ